MARFRQSVFSFPLFFPWYLYNSISKYLVPETPKCRRSVCQLSHLPRRHDCCCFHYLLLIPDTSFPFSPNADGKRMRGRYTSDLSSPKRSTEFVPSCTSENVSRRRLPCAKREPFRCFARANLFNINIKIRHLFFLFSIHLYAGRTSTSWCLSLLLYIWYIIRLPCQCLEYQIIPYEPSLSGK